MKYTLLGNSDLNVSEIGFGCMSLGGGQDATTALVHEAIERGVNLFDTADLYQNGQNETMLGHALKGKRQDVYLATKVGNQWRPDGSGWDWNPRKEYILEAVEASLKRLQTDYLDLYQLHGGTLDDPIDEVIEAFESLKLAGKIRYYGISSIRPNVIEEYVARAQIVSVMMQYSLLDRRPEETCLDLLRQHSIGVLARGPLAKGLLVDKAAIPYLSYKKEQVAVAAQAVRDVSGALRSPAQSALKFVMRQAAVTCAVAGIRTQQQLDDCLGAADAPDFSPDERQRLQDALPAMRYELHRS